MTSADPGPGAAVAREAGRGAMPVSALVLIAANTAPVVGVLALHWSIFIIILLYWCENVVVGVFNVLRMALAEPRGTLEKAGKAVLIPFFIAHYGIFTIVHGVFVVALFGSTNTLRELVAGGSGLLWGLGAMVASHGYSFVTNYLRTGEYRRVDLGLLLFQPYARVVVMHLTILGGGLAAQKLGAPLAALLVLIALKTGVDLVAHLAERRKFGAR